MKKHLFKDIDVWQDLRVDKATTQRINLSNQWVWEIKKAHWQNVPKLKIIGDVRIGERFAYGGGSCRRWGGNKGNYDLENGRAKTMLVKRPQAINVPAPEHLYVSTRNIIAKSTGSNPTFSLLCSDNWTVSSDKDWCRVDQSTQSGTDTGDVYKEIKLYIDPHPDAGQTENTRIATIRVTEQRSRVLTKKVWHWYEGHPITKPFLRYWTVPAEERQDGVNGYYEEVQIPVQLTSLDISVMQSSKD